MRLKIKMQTYSACFAAEQKAYRGMETKRVLSTSCFRANYVKTVKVSWSTWCIVYHLIRIKTEA